MRDEMNILIRLTWYQYGVQFSPSRRMGSFSDWRPALLFPYTKQYVITADFNGTNRFSCFLGLLGREHMVWEHENRKANSAPRTPMNCNFFKMISPWYPSS
jgi:hypothetical protein